MTVPEDSDSFSLTIRLYWPDQVVLDGNWPFPTIEQV